MCAYRDLAKTPEYCFARIVKDKKQLISKALLLSCLRYPCYTSTCTVLKLRFTTSISTVPNLRGLFRVSFWNLTRKYTHIYSFREHTFSTKVSLMSAFFWQKISVFLAKSTFTQSNSVRAVSEISLVLFSVFVRWKVI